MRSWYKYLENLDDNRIENQGKTILLITDSAKSASELKKFLKYNELRIVIRNKENLMLSKLYNEEYDLFMIDCENSTEWGYQLCSNLKKNELTRIIPTLLFMKQGSSLKGLINGASDCLFKNGLREELLFKIKSLIDKSEYNIDVNPTSKLPGSATIEKEIKKRINSREKFALCYADLDNFKAFNDKYGYSRADRVIFITSRVIRDTVNREFRESFIGHIGGDDFIILIPPEKIDIVCNSIISEFDKIAPYFYNSEDKERGFILSMNRKNQYERFSIMSISIGVATNLKRNFRHSCEVSNIASEMKNYAKRFEGSIYIVDRRKGDFGNEQNIV